MNGRIYEPQIGRFLSPDPFIQDVTNTQNLNRYTYVNNNPLSYTDPSGYFFKKLFRAIKKVLKAVVKLAVAAVIAYALGPFLGPVVGILPGAVQPFVVAGISRGITDIVFTGRPKSFGVGFAQGVATHGIGEVFGHEIDCFFCTENLGSSVSHGVVGGAVDLLPVFRGTWSWNLFPLG